MSLLHSLLCIIDPNQISLELSIPYPIQTERDKFVLASQSKQQYYHGVDDHLQHPLAITPSLHRMAHLVVLRVVVGSAHLLRKSLPGHQVGVGIFGKDC
jgi:hypothetical protein